MIPATLRTEYCRFRRIPATSPAKALECARKAIAGGVPAHFVTYHTVADRGAVMGAAFKVAGSAVRWAENTHSIGLRFVGMADSVAPRSVQHKGWYCSDDNMTGETARGAVWQLPARDSKPRFVAGMYDPVNEGPALLIVDSIADDEISAAQSADYLAERYAEEEREYQRVASARMRHDELNEQIRDTRKDALSLIRELQVQKRAFGGFPATCKALRNQVATMLESVGALRVERDDIAHCFASHAAWAI